MTLALHLSGCRSVGGSVPAVAVPLARSADPGEACRGNTGEESALPIGPEFAARIESLLDRADDADDAGRWDELESIATEILDLDADNVEATGLLAKAQRRRDRDASRIVERVEGERRTVTVAFVDLVNSTELADLTDPEVLQEIIRWYHRLVGETVVEAGGYVARFMGDGALVYFGYPHSTDEAPRQAIHAGLEIIERVGQRKPDILSTYDVRIDVRVGIHTGLAVIARMGGGNRAEVNDIVGETPNIAARLESMATPGSVFISQGTRDLVDGYFDTSARGPQQLKGISRSVDVHEVVGRTGAINRLDAASTSERTPLIGRRRETELLAGAWDSTVQGNGRVVVLSGEAGVGKSRLLEWLCALAADHPVARTACAPHTQASPFRPLRTLSGVADLESMTIKDDRSIDVGPASASREDALDAAVQRLLRVADEPMLLVFEDIHWADASSLEVLGRLAERIETTPLLLVATLRPEIAPAWFGLPSVHELSVDPLTVSGVNDMAAHLLASEPTPSLAEWLMERTGGVPLYVEEVLRSIGESGQIAMVLDAAGALQVDIPPTLQGVLLGRLDRLGPAKIVAQVAAVIGRVFDVGLLERVVDAGAECLRRDLGDLERAGLVEPTDRPGRFAFRHALIRDAAYESILRSTTRQLHSAIADAMVDLDPDVSDRSPEVVAQHLSDAQRFDEALVLFETAARAAARRSAHLEAIAHIDAALYASAERDGESIADDELRLRLMLGPSLIAARGYGSEEVAVNYQRAYELCGDASDSQEFFDSARGLTSYYLLSEQLSRATDLAESALACATRQDDSSELLEATAWLGTVRFFGGETAGAAAMLDEAIDLHDPVAHHHHAVRYGLDPWVLAVSHRVWLHWLSGVVDEALELCDVMLERAQQLEHPLSHAHALNYALGLDVFLGRYDEARRRADIQIALSKESHLPHYEAYAHIFRGRAEASDDPVVGAASIRAGLDQRKATGALLALPLHHALLAEVSLLGKDLEEADIHTTAGLEIAEETGERWWVSELLRLSARVNHALERPGIEESLRAAYRLASSASAGTLMARIVLTADDILANIEVDDPLHVERNQRLINAETPETLELIRRLR